VSHVDVDGARLWVEDSGDGEDWILSCASGFDRYPVLLAEPPYEHHVLTIQARGFGRSTHLAQPPAEGWLDRWAADVLEVADRLGIDRFVYTGVSHGGGIGWHLARRHPERLRALVSVVGTPHDRNGDTSSSAGRRRIVANAGDREVVTEQFRVLGGRADSPEQADARERIAVELAERILNQSEEENAINQGMPFPEARTNDELAAILETIRVPVLILAGMRDGVISPQSALRAVTAVPHAKAVMYEAEGHFIAREHPERLAREIAVFLDELTPAQARA
jgi:pimeloyl-ACP methyl ester carboxylesterase